MHILDTYIMHTVYTFYRYIYKLYSVHTHIENKAMSLHLNFQ